MNNCNTSCAFHTLKMCTGLLKQCWVILPSVFQLRKQQGCAAVTVMSCSGAVMYHSDCTQWCSDVLQWCTQCAVMYCLPTSRSLRRFIVFIGFVWFCPGWPQIHYTAKNDRNFWSSYLSLLKWGTAHRCYCSQLHLCRGLNSLCSAYSFGFFVLFGLSLKFLLVRHFTFFLLT